METTSFKWKMFVIKDEKSHTYGLPMCSQTRGMFLRDFIVDQLQRGEAVFAKHPTDFSIFEIGEYDITTGEFDLYESKNCIGLVADYREVQ